MVVWRFEISTADIELFLAILALVANLATLLAVSTEVIGRLLDTPLRGWFGRLLGGQALVAALVVALTAMGGSLYFSEVAHFTPCVLCWYQRIAMYPLVLLLGIAAYRRDWRIRPYVASLAAVGAVISIYHLLIENFPNIHSVACSKELPCNLIWFQQFGFITIAYMALSAFLLIIVLMWLGGPIEETVESGEKKKAVVEAGA